MAIRFRVDGDLRFISHHDTMRLFERALARAGLPVKFSEGFNPRARMSLPLPRPVGVATSADLLVIELQEPASAPDVLASLQQQMPPGLTLLEAFEVPGARKLHPGRVSYEVPVPGEQFEAVRQAVERLLAADSRLIERTDERGAPLRSIDLRPMLTEARAEAGWLRWTHCVSDSGSARPAEWLSAFGLNPADLLHRVRRTAVAWQADSGTGSGHRPDDTAGR